MMPLSDFFRVRIRILRLGAFSDQTLTWLRKDLAVKPPLDKFLLFLLFVVSSYLPALIATLVYNSTCKKETPRCDPAMFQYNREDAAEMK